MIALNFTIMLGKFHLALPVWLSFVFSQSIGLPKIDYNDEIISHTYYTLSYNEQHEQADWVAYQLTKSMIELGRYERTDNFRPDYKVKNNSSQLSDYKGSGYDRGHLCPAGDMTISKTAMSESFLMSNISPQNPSFNRGIWRSLEANVRTWAVENSEIYIVTGPILNQQINGSIGYNNVSIPMYYFKVILDYTKPEIKGIGFILKNQGSQSSLQSYAVPIDRVEELTGIDFFNQLPDQIENTVEKSFSINQWNWKETNAKNSGKTSSVSCKGKTTSGKSCNNKTLNQSGYCYIHQQQSNPSYNPQSERLSYSSQCISYTKSGNRCKRNTYCSNKKCSSHGGNCY